MAGRHQTNDRRLRVACDDTLDVRKIVLDVDFEAFSGRKALKKARGGPLGAVVGDKKDEPHVRGDARDALISLVGGERRR